MSRRFSASILKSRIDARSRCRAQGGSQGFVTDLAGFLKTRKKFWLLPLIIILVALCSLLVFAGGSAIAPFIYTIF